MELAPQEVLGFESHREKFLVEKLDDHTIAVHIKYIWHGFQYLSQHIEFEYKNFGAVKKPCSLS